MQVYNEKWNKALPEKNALSKKQRKKYTKNDA